jgi:hypothetical protein
MQSRYVAMAKAARARDSKVEPLFLSLATEQAIDDSTESNDDHLDMLESITPQLRPMLKDFKLNDKAQSICRSVERMTAEEYHIPPSGRFQVHPVTGVAGKPFWWDLFGHFNLQAFAIAQSLVNKLGRFRLNQDFCVSMDQVIDDIMLILCPLVRYYSGGRSYDSRRQQLMTTLDLDEEVHHITRAFIHYRAFKSSSVGAGDHEAEFTAARIRSLADHHMVDNRSVSPVVLRECGWTRERFGIELSSRVHSLRHPRGRDEGDIEGGLAQEHR